MPKAALLACSGGEHSLIFIAISPGQHSLTDYPNDQKRGWKTPSRITSAIFISSNVIKA